MANKEHLAILKQGVEAWNRWRDETKENLDRADLAGAKLSGADLSGINLSYAILSEIDLFDASLVDATLYSADLGGAKLRGANLSGAILQDANLRSANLFRANLQGADLVEANFFIANLPSANLIKASLDLANFDSANLKEANLSGAHICNVNLTSAKLRGANLQDAIVGNTSFANCDLSEAKGLDSITHTGPSTIGIDTIYKSRGNIPEGFLRGCGVPEGFITQMYSLVGAVDGIQFYSCFISYSGKDEDFAKRLHGKMRDAHLRVWFAPEDIQGGKKLHEQIETAIRVFDKLLVVLSEASLQSEWVMDELRKGFKAERDTGKRKLFPVRLTDYETLKRWECRDSISGKDLAEEVRQYFIPDFSNWKDHDQFEAGFTRLLKDLRAEERAK